MDLANCPKLEQIAVTFRAFSTWDKEDLSFPTHVDSKRLSTGHLLTSGLQITSLEVTQKVHKAI